MKKNEKKHRHKKKKEKRKGKRKIENRLNMDRKKKRREIYFSPSTVLLRNKSRINHPLDLSKPDKSAPKWFCSEKYTAWKVLKPVDTGL